MNLETGRTASLKSSESLPTGTHTGNLDKWTNWSTGYKKRYFTLSDGVLSYYNSQHDFPQGCRGSISLKVARIIYNYAHDPVKIQIVGRGSVKYVVKASTADEAKKWVLALTQAKQHLQEKDQNMGHDYDEHEVGSSGTESSGTSISQEPAVQIVDPASDEQTVRLLGRLEMTLRLQEHLILSLRPTTAEASAVKATCIEVRNAAEALTQAQAKMIAFYKQQVSSLRDERKIWESNLTALAKQHEELENQVTITGPAAAESEDEESFFDAVDTYQDMKRSVSVKTKLQSPDDATETGTTNDLQIEKLAVGYPTEPRTEFPRDPNKGPPSVSLWGVLKNNIGKDLSKIALPCAFNEPISMLQRFCEVKPLL